MFTSTDIYPLAQQLHALIPTRLRRWTGFPAVPSDRDRLADRDSVLRWLKGSSEEDALARALANGDQKAITAALKSGKVQVKQRK